MLKQEKMPKKKIIFYVIVIAVMFLATGFMIYKNYKLTAVNNPKNFSNGLDADIAKRESEAETAGKNTVSGLEIFTDQKFKELKQNLLKKVNFIVGKEDPFEARK